MLTKACLSGLGNGAFNDDAYGEKVAIASLHRYIAGDVRRLSLLSKSVAERGALEGADEGVELSAEGAHGEGATMAGDRIRLRLTSRPIMTVRPLVRKASRTDLTLEVRERYRRVDQADWRSAGATGCPHPHASPTSRLWCSGSSSLGNGAGPQRQSARGAW